MFFTDFNDKSIQVNSCVVDKCIQVEQEKYSDFIKSDSELSFMTGLDNFKLLQFLEDVVKIVVPMTELNLCQKNSLLSIINDRLVLTFIKLKHNLPYTVLCVLFKIKSNETCRKIFLRMIKILAVDLQSAIQCPSKKKIFLNMLKCFENFTNRRVVVLEDHQIKPYLSRVN